MIVNEPKKVFILPLYWGLCIIVWIWNPFSRRLKVVRAERYILDVRSRRQSKRCSKIETMRRKCEGEEVRQCFKILSKGSVDMGGSTG